MDVAKLEEDTAREKQRSRTMSGDIGFISAYPFSDPVAHARDRLGRLQEGEGAEPRLESGGPR